MATRIGGVRRVRRPGLERLEDRALLNASIDIAADGSLVYRTDSTIAESLVVSTAAGVYTFAVAAGDNPIDVATNAAGLAVTGSGTRTVTVTSPASLRIEAAGGGQTIRVQSTATATAIVLQGDQENVVLGAGPAGIQGLSGAITVSAATGSELNSLTVDDGGAAYDAGSTPSYVVAAGAITSNDATVRSRFPGVSYSGVSNLTVRGTSSAAAPSPSYLVLGTANGVSTTIDASSGPDRRDISILGTSAVATSRLTILSAGEANVYVASIDSAVAFSGGGGRASIYMETVRGANYGIDGDFVVQNPGGVVDVSMANYWNVGTRRGSPSWFLGFDPGVASEFAALRDASSGTVGGLFFRPGEVHGLSVNGQGNQGASLMVDFRNGDPLPFGAAAGGVNGPRAGLTYVGAAGVGAGATYALSFVGGSFASESHQAFPLYRGLVELTETGGAVRNVAYQLTATAPLLDDAATVADYRWFYDIMNGAVDGTRTLPDGTVVSAVLASTLVVVSGGTSISGALALGLAEANTAVMLSRYVVAAKTNVRVLRGWSSAAVTTIVNYVPPPADPAAGEGAEPPTLGLTSLSIEDASPPELPTSEVVRLQALPAGAATFVLQNGGDDSVVVVLAGIAGATQVGLDGGGQSALETAGDNLYIDASGLALSTANFVPIAPGAFTIPALAADSAPISARNYETASVFNSSTPTFSIQPVTIPAQTLVPLTDVTAGVLTSTIPGFSAEGLVVAVDWGDGQTTRATLQAVPGSPNSYRVVGSHTYNRAGLYTPRIAVGGDSTATTTVAGVKLNFQVRGATGTTATAPAIAGRLSASSDSGVSDSDAITNVVRTSYQGTNAIPGAWIEVYATSSSGGALFLLGSTVADAAGNWSVASNVPLVDGTYTVQARSASTSTWANGVATLAASLVIDTVGPRITGVEAAPLSGTISVILRDFGGSADAGAGVDIARARDAASYAIAAATGAPQAATVASVLPGSTNRLQTVTLRLGARVRPGDYLLTALSSLGRSTGLRDIAGNPLDGAFSGGFPSGGANSGGDFRARLTLATNRLQSVRPA